MYTIQAELIQEPVVVFVVATTGQGDEPDNMKVMCVEIMAVRICKCVLIF